MVKLRNSQEYKIEMNFDDFHSEVRTANVARFSLKKILFLIVELNS